MPDTSRRDFLKTTAAAAALGLLPDTLHAAEPVLGLMYPPPNYPLPPEVTQLYPKGIKFLAEGLGLEKMTPEEYDRVVPRIMPAADRMKKAGATALSIMGTSLTFYKGAKYNQELIDGVRKATGLPTTSMSTGIVKGLQAVNAKRIAVATAYSDEVNNRLKLFLQESGFEILGLKGMGIVSFADAPPVTQEGLFKFCGDTYAAFPKADALLVSCGNLKTTDLVVPLEAQCKVPVVSSTPAALWYSVKTAGVSGKSAGFGQLLSKG
ncbi:MAG: twin-arginine translocation signal domain-containing protein [Bryobacteraceae bacterium]